MNKVIIVGNIGKDAETGGSDSGRKWAKLNVATSESWKDKNTGERKEKVEWHRVTCWGDGLCGFLGQYAKKGGKVLIEGQLQTRKWQDKQGQDRYTTEIVVQGAGGVVRLLGRPGDGGAPMEEPDGRWAGTDREWHTED